MSESTVIYQLMSASNSILVSAGIDAEVRRSNQPTPQGLDNDAKSLVLLTTISNVSLGDSYHTNDDGLTTFTKNALYRVQLDIVADFDPTDPLSKSALAIAETLSDSFSMPSTISELRLGGIKMQEVGEVRSVYMTNERQQYESTPSFDMLIQFNRSYQQTPQGVTSVELVVDKV